jgi:IclR family pca regulon transcriptional regulator
VTARQRKGSGVDASKASEAPHAEQRPPEHVQSLERGLAVLKAFGEAQPQMTLSEVAKTVGLARGAARRFLLTLQRLGYIESNGRYFRLRPQTLELGYTYLASQPWWRGAHREVERLAIEVGRAVAAGVLDRDDVLYVAHALPQPIPGFTRSVGTRLPAFASAQGRVILGNRSEAEREAYLARAKLTPLTRATIVDPAELRARFAAARADGYATIDQELEFGLWSIAVPIFDRGGSVPAAIGLSVHDLQVSRSELAEHLLGPLQRASRAISAGLPT